MKRLVSLICITSLVFTISCSRKPKVETAPIPEQSVVYGYFDSLQTSIDGICASKFYTEMAKLELWNDPMFQEFIVKAKESLQKSEEQIGLPLNKETFMSIFGKRFEYALVPGEGKPDFVLCADLGIKSKVVEVADIISKYSSQNNSQVEVYEKYDVTNFTSKTGQTFSYFFAGNYLIFTSSPKLSKTCIDILYKKAKPYSANLRAASRLASLQSVKNAVLIDIPAILELAPESQDTALAAIKSINDIDFFVIGCSWNPGGLDGFVSVNYKDNSKITTSLGSPATVKEASKWIPDESILASSGAVKLNDLIVYQSEKLNLPGQEANAKRFNELKTQIDSILGVKIDEQLAQILGEGLFFTVQSINTQGLFPMPEMAFGVAVKDEDKAKALMNRIEGVITAQYAKQHLQFATNQIENVDCRFVPLPLGPNLAPIYAVTNNYLIIASSVTGMQESIKSMKGSRKTLIESEKFKEMSKISSTNSLAFNYMDTEQFLLILRDLVNNYRVFFPEQVNPDHVRDALQTMSNFSRYYADVQIKGNEFVSHAKMIIK